jgi:hypothetical protein
MNPGDLDPLFITSPSIRCGTTVLQRLLCSSRHALIYGELCGADLEVYLNLYVFKTKEYGIRKQIYAAGLRDVLQGKTDEWIPDLMPDIDSYLAALAQSSFAGLAHCRSYALEVGRSVWGIKFPGWKPSTIKLLRDLMPRSRFIYIYRDLIACLKSAKAQHLLRSMIEVKDFCRAWQASLTYMLGLRDDPAILLINYAELISEREYVLDRIAHFTMLDDLDVSTLDRKINTWVTGEHPLHAPDGYMVAAELSNAELQVAAETSLAVRPLFDLTAMAAN